MNGFWRWCFKPEVLFLFGTVQALLPYALWHLYGPNLSYLYPITYVPAVFWISGYCAFWVGAKLAGRRRYAPIRPLGPRGRRRLVTLTIVVVAALAVQCAALVAVYGGIPILQLLRGEAALINVDDAAQAHSFVGQLALFLISQFLLDALLLLLLIAATSGERRHRLLMVAGLVTLVIAGLFAGKRQALVIAAVFLGTGSAVYFGHPVKPILRYLGIRRPRWWARAAMVGLPLLFVAFLGWIVSLRTGETHAGRTQLAAYLQLGLINFETQAGEVGYGPKEFKPLRLLQYVVPNRVAAQMDAFAQDPPPRSEPTAPAGFYGDLHWNTGLAGAVAFALCVGFLAKYFYVRATTSPFHLLVYSLMTWTLIAPFLYNHFLAANFMLFPALAYAILVRLLGISRRRRGRRSGADIQRPSHGEARQDLLLQNR